MDTKFSTPRWQQDLARFLPLKSQFVLTGNVRDLQATDVAGTVTPQRFPQALGDALFSHGYKQVVLFDQLHGFQSMAPTIPPAAQTDGAGALEVPTSSGTGSGLDSLGGFLPSVVRHAGAPVALIIDFASRLPTRSDALTAAEHQFFTQALILSHEARPRPIQGESKSFVNTVLWVVEREGDLPDWLVVANPRIRVIPVANPDHLVRRALGPGLLQVIPGFREASQGQRDSAVKEFVDSTEGLLIHDLSAIATLGRVEGVQFANVSDAVRRYKVGITEDPWRKLDRDKIRGADATVKQRVKGQDMAATHMLDLVKRAVTGVGGKRGNRPRGIAFLAGPTGVGKTELAKTITSLLFGDEGAYIRFDMSEFSSEHADQRLIGAPPGYVGYDMGGELTNAVREKPFSVVLFDEIEKAHPRILDKFLQILDDGVLTSGRGDRVYFSETLIIFTSNLGIYRADESGHRVANVKPEDSYEVIREKVLREISDHFKLVLNRPEILNRMGENIIVFDFIRQDVGLQIFDQMLDAIVDDLRAKQFGLTLHESARAHLQSECLRDLSHGGRGIRNQLEALLVNPLARQLFDVDAQPGQSFTLMHHADTGRLELERG